MNASQVHLALTHFPVVLSIVGVIMLIVAFASKNTGLKRTSFYVLIAAGIATLPVFFTGEGAEEIIEDMPGVSESMIKQHEEIAKFALIAIITSAVLSVAALIPYKLQTVSRVLTILVFVSILASSALLAQTAHLGGQIRHPEIRTATIAAAENNNAGEGDESLTKNQKHEDD
ncbi:MAG: DUF2231 domain-containing protein [Candidatus Dadabacteria bacterium]